MSARWKAFWDDHAHRVGTDEPLRRVLRVYLGRPIGQEVFDRVTQHVVARLEIEPEHRVLDLCCGNGLLSAAITPACRTLIGVDFCVELLREVPGRTGGKAVAVAGDAVSIEFRSASFDRVLLAAALQHFEEPDVIHLFRKVARFLRPRGILLITDIPDHARMWAFFDDADREDAYFSQRANATPILGTWFEKSWLVRLARHAGFSEAIASDQPLDHPYSHYRFDLRCRK